MTLDKFVFVADADYDTDVNFGTITDADLDGVASTGYTNEVFMAAGSVLDVNGDFTMGNGSVLNMLISTPGTHDQLDVSGTLTADGTLDIDAGGFGFAGEAGDVFDILSFGAVSGSFDTINLPVVEGLLWETSDLLVTGEISLYALDGDFNADGKVDAADYTVWRDNLGGDEEALTFGTGDGSGTVDAADYAIWVANFGNEIPSSAFGAAVPEPTSAMLLLLASVGFIGRTTRK